MTGVLLHGITRADSVRPEDEPRHRRVLAGELCGLVTPVTSSLMGADDMPPLEEAETHHRLLSAYALGSDVLPVRFGTAFSGEDAVAASLHLDRQAHLARLERFADRVEYILTVAQTTSPAEPSEQSSAEATNGRDFLARKRRARDAQRSRGARRAAFVQQLPAVLRTSTLDVRPTPPWRRDVLTGFALLVDRGAVVELIETASKIANAATDLGLAMKLRGPGPCYAFAAEDDEKGDEVNNAAARAAEHADA